MKIVFMGTPDFARAALEKIIEAGHEVVLVVTQPDKPKGRSGELQVSDVKECALLHGLPVFQPVRIKLPENVAELRKYDADIYVVAAFGQILSQEILDIPRLGCVNIHASLLPEYRGAAPIQQAILDGRKETGVTIMQMAAGMDTGDILTQRTIPIAEDETGGGLFDKLSALGAELIVETLPKLERGEITPVPQDEDRATKCGKLSKDMGRIQWSDDADKLRNLVRGLNPWPSAYTSLNKKSFKIWRAKALMELEFRQMAKELGDDKDGVRAKALDDKAYGTVMAVLRDSFVVLTGDGYLQIFEVQLEGKKRMPVKDFLMGYKLEVGAKLGD
ncbi:methionyl-tRNA formyltransferase Fmt [Butyrivibrio proteoclasticus B316]|uniref:Methionyl-tRNA formyltransferase n=1 Tax=Butyrivibrio proteoclasticus (strain ATCC 51982 / DSM 14932 / B316) TaxID=515622 RepID=E0RYN0_BUTPB|nr:methionyl-tRNA formyltransferase [Butyrivibrio proteoclasticus]ADL34725.1 methionyl-tRNA formyltransferase Fmt [Butyrivibrio proteoclasticus B316]